MDLETIKKIVNSDSPSKSKELQILYVLAADKNAIPTILDILNAERKSNYEMITDLNLNLSRTHIFVDEYVDKVKEKQFTRAFILDKISEFYIKYKGRISHCFNRFND